MGDVLQNRPLSNRRTGVMRRSSREHWGGDVKRSGNAAIDISSLVVRLAEGDDLAVAKDRPDQAHVEKRVRRHRIVDGKDVAFMDVALEMARDVGR